MKINLYITPYAEKNPDRLKELEECLKRNSEAGFNKIFWCVEEKDIAPVSQQLNSMFNPQSCSQSINIFDHRPTFSDYIGLANLFEDSKDNGGDEETLHVVCNTDIYFLPESLEQLKNLPWDKKLFVALSRWDRASDGKTLSLLDRWDSADAWCWRGKANVKQTNCGCGFAGGDNSLAWIFKDAGYHVVNPSRDIKSVHVHRVLINNYRDENTGAVKSSHVCPEPYHFHTPIHINQI